MLANYGNQSTISSLDLINFDTTKVENFEKMLEGIKLKEVTLGTNFNLNLTSSGVNLTNSSGRGDAT